MNENLKKKELYLIKQDFRRYKKMLKCFFIVSVIGHLFIAFSEIISQLTPGTIMTFQCGDIEVPPLSFMNILLNIEEVLNLWIGTGMVVIFIYSFLIWYREWYGNNKTIYTLLSIPMKIHIIIFCKFCNVMLVYFMYLLTQVVCIFLDYFFMKIIINPSRLAEASIMESVERTCPLLPYNLWTLLLYLLVVITIIMIIFSFVMTERCYKSKGIFLFMTIIIFTMIIFFKGPYMFHGVIKGETALKYTVMAYLGVIFLSTIVGNYFNTYHLLKNKVDV